MNLNPEKISRDFLEISSQQRLSIILSLFEKKSNISEMAKHLEATSPEVHRNFTRMLKSGLIVKEPDRNYTLSTYGKTVYAQIPSLMFVSENKKFFENHNFGSLPTKFIQRLGALNEKKHIKGFVKVLEKWNNIHQNAEKYIHNILSEVHYNKETIDIVESKLKEGIKISSIFAENTVVPEDRKKLFKKKNFAKYIAEGRLDRKMTKSISIVILLNEKESGIIFPRADGTPDLSEMFYSNDLDFHEWCFDFFEYNWNKSSSFQERKLK